MDRVTTVLLAALVAGCGAGGGDGDGGGGAAARASSPLVLVAGMVPLEPERGAPWADGVDTARLGVTPGSVDAYYDLSTPAGESFLFDVVSRSPGNTGPVRVSVAHAADDGNAPAGGPETMAGAGIVPSAPGAVNRAPWLDSLGDGYGRVSLRGTVDREQVFAVEAETGGRRTTALVRLRIGEESAINLAARPGTDYPGVEDSRTLYSSNSWMFGLPTTAVSGDRTTVVAYEGDRADPDRYQRYEMRLQLDNIGGAVTGGASDEASADSGNWRDHEVAGLFNTLALVHSGTDAVTLRISFDRGATFAQAETLVEEAADGRYLPRLAQVAMAADYSLAVAFWRTSRDGTSDLVLVEGRPSAFDGGGSPTRFRFDPATTLWRVEGDVTPAVMGACWSDGGDLVLGYAFTSFRTNGDGTWTSLTQSRCAVRPWGGEFTDVLVDEEVIVGKDPSVAVLGSGASMRVFYAYEGSDGVRLRVSADGGRTFGAPVAVGDASSSVPTVLARDQDGKARVDLLYLSQGEAGCELRALHWDDFGSGPPTDHRLTTAETIPSASTPRDRPVPGAGFAAMPPEVGFRVREVAWSGYDAVVDGDDVVLVYDEVTYDAWTIFMGGWFMDGREGAPGGAAFAEEQFDPAEPPPLAPGLTEPVPAPDPDHMHQLKMFRLD